MCISDRQSSTVSSSSTLSSDSSHDTPYSVEQVKKLEAGRPFVLSSLQLFTLGVLLAAVTTAFSLEFPFIVTPEAATKTYHRAFYDYQKETSLFDNTPWTYGTDYLLFAIMAFFAFFCLFSDFGNPHSIALRLRSAGLLFCYMISVLAGAWSHQHFLTVESRNTSKFRILWTICVGTVTAACGFMGACGSELARNFALDDRLRNNRSGSLGQYAVLPLVPESFWIGYGGYCTVYCAYGGISYQRPACDIFLAGTVQTWPTFYLLAVLALRKWHDTNKSAQSPCGTNEGSNAVTSMYRLMCYIGFLLNAPLFPMYPLLVQYTDWTLGSINTLLHSWLLVAWSIQGICLRRFCKAMGSSTVREHSS